MSVILNDELATPGSGTAVLNVIVHSSRGDTVFEKEKGLLVKYFRKTRVCLIPPFCQYVYVFMSERFF